MFFFVRWFFKVLSGENIIFLILLCFVYSPPSKRITSYGCDTFSKLTITERKSYERSVAERVKAALVAWSGFRSKWIQIKVVSWAGLFGLGLCSGLIKIDEMERNQKKFGTLNDDFV